MTIAETKGQQAQGIVEAGLYASDLKNGVLQRILQNPRYAGSLLGWTNDNSAIDLELGEDMVWFKVASYERNLADATITIKLSTAQKTTDEYMSDFNRGLKDVVLTFSTAFGYELEILEIVRNSGENGQDLVLTRFDFRNEK